jgi:hypothetical protein
LPDSGQGRFDSYRPEQLVKSAMPAYPPVSTDEQDLAAQLDTLAELGVSADRIYVVKD